LDRTAPIQPLRFGSPVDRVGHHELIFSSLRIQSLQGVTSGDTYSSELSFFF
jgi:hypothetical protein